MIPSPWGSDVEEAMRSPDARPLCFRCLEPLEGGPAFCPQCGAATGEYTNWSPYLYLFTVGDILRQGTSGRFRVRPLTVAGFLLFSLLEYTVFAPVYWFLLLRNLRSQRSKPDPVESEHAGSASSPSQGESSET
jgi:hypothetical protein